MKFQSIYQLSKQISSGELSKEIEKRKNSPMVFNLDKRYFLSYDFAYLNLILLKTKDDQLLSNCYNNLDDLSKRFLLEKASINELESLMKFSFVKNTNQYIFEYFMGSDTAPNYLFLNAYKDLLSSKIKTPTDIDSLNVLYEKYVKPRNLAFKKRNVKKFHKFRDSAFNEDLEHLSIGDSFSKNTYRKCLSLFNKAPSSEDEIVSSMNEAFFALYNSDLDIYSKGGVFLFKFLLTMPYYGVLNNLFLAIITLASYFYNDGKELLALSLTQILFSKNNLSSLVNYFYETVSKDNHGDLMHFLYPFVSMLKDGVLEMTQNLKTLQSKEKYLSESFTQDFSKSEKQLLDVLIPSSIYSLYGCDVNKMGELTKVSLPTINRFLKRLKDEERLKKTRIGKKDFYKII